MLSWLKVPVYYVLDSTTWGHGINALDSRKFGKSTIEGNKMKMQNTEL